MHAEIIVLRLVHVVCGMLWVGAIVFMAGFLTPAIQIAGPAAGGAIMGALQQRRAMTFLPVVAVLTLLSGFRLYWIMSDGFSAAYAHSPMGLTFGIAGIVATVAFILGMAIARPAMMRAGMLAQQLATVPEAQRGPLQAELARLRTRGRSMSIVVAVLVVLAGAAMAVARYL